MWELVGCTCGWASDTPYALVAEGVEGTVMAHIRNRLGESCRLVTRCEQPEACLSGLDARHTSVDIVGHVQNGAIAIGKWQLQEPLGRGDVNMFEAIASQMGTLHVRLLRILGCGALLNRRAARALFAVERLLAPMDVQVFGTRTKIDETSFDPEMRRFRNDLDCAVLSRPRLEFLKAFGILVYAASPQATMGRAVWHANAKNSYAVSLALAQREVEGRSRPRWPIVVSYSVRDSHRFVGALRPCADIAEPPADMLLCEVVFVDEASPARSIRAFVWDHGVRVLVRINDMRVGQLFVSSREEMAPKEGGEVRC